MGTSEQFSGERELQAVFQRETDDLVTQMEAALLSLERNAGDRASLKTFFRALHSVKGNAACVGRSDLEDYAHSLETTLHPLREGARIVNTELLEELFPAVYRIRDAVLGGTAAPQGEMINHLEDLIAAAPQQLAPAEPNRYRVTLEYPGEAIPVAFDPAQAFLDLADVGRIAHVELDRSSILPLDRLENPDALSLRYHIELSTEKTIDEVRDGCFVFDDVIKVQIDPIAQAKAAAPTAAAANEHGNKLGLLRIEAHKIDGLLNMAGELSISNARMRRLVADGASPQELLDVLDELERHSRGMQEQILGARMIAIDSLFRPFIRLVRELSASLGKRMHLITHGNEVELDKTIVEQMREPLTHMIRNAVDHGMETPEERTAAGKSPEGRIVLRAAQREGSIYLEIHDDGRGIDRKKLRERAIEAGIINANVTLSDAQIDNLIFETGLSTASRVTNISGRGMGMDIVRKSVEQIRGEIHLENNPGTGCSFFVRLPLTLALLDGVVLRDGPQNFIAPLFSLEEAVYVAPGTLRRVAHQGVFFKWRGVLLPILKLRSGFEANGNPAGQAGICVVLRFENRFVGVLVDEVVDQQQFVIKSLEENFQRVDGYTGATITGDGSVALILDVPTLVRSVEVIETSTLQEGEHG